MNMIDCANDGIVALLKEVNRLRTAAKSGCFSLRFVFARRYFDAPYDDMTAGFCDIDSFYDL